MREINFDNKRNENKTKNGQFYISLYIYISYVKVQGGAPTLTAFSDAQNLSNIVTAITGM